MTETGRYDVSGLIEAQYQKGSRGRVLRNLLGISGKRVMEEILTGVIERTLKRRSQP